jgi:hypothetical protein
VEDAPAAKFRKTGVSRQRHQFVHHHRVDDERGNPCLDRQFPCDQAAEVRRVLAGDPVAQVVDHVVIDPVHSTYQRFDETAPADDGGEPA